MTTLSGKVALVTGGTSGIGKATAIALAQAGAKVVVAGSILGCSLLCHEAGKPAIPAPMTAISVMIQ